MSTSTFLVSESITQGTYRQFDYARMMSHRTQLARWLHTRLAHNYTNASLSQPYVCLYSSLRRDSGLLEYGRTRDAVAAIDEALGILRTDRVVSSVERVTQLGPRNRIEEVKYSLTPHPDFVREVKVANGCNVSFRQACMNSAGWSGNVGAPRSG